jgi:hypothetical protein
MERVLKHWAPACHAVGEEPVTVRSLGRAVRIEDEKELDETAGEFFVSLLKSLRDFGVFNGLPRAEKCYLGVAALGGWFGWPPYENRGSDNIV